MNHSSYIKPETYINNIILFNDMGHLNFSSTNGINGDKNIIFSYIFNHIYPNNIIRYFKDHTCSNGIISTSHLKLKPNLKNKWTYTFAHNNNNYILNVIYDL